MVVFHFVSFCCKCILLQFLKVPSFKACFLEPAEMGAYFALAGRCIGVLYVDKSSRACWLNLIFVFQVQKGTTDTQKNTCFCVRLLFLFAFEKTISCLCMIAWWISASYLYACAPSKLELFFCYNSYSCLYKMKIKSALT